MLWLSSLADTSAPQRVGAALFVERLWIGRNFPCFEPALGARHYTPRFSPLQELLPTAVLPPAISQRQALEIAMTVWAA